MKYTNSSVLEKKNKILSLVEKQNKWRSECINMIASENVMSPLAERMYTSDFMHRYAEGEPFNRYYNGTKYIDELEVLVSELMGELLDVKHVDPRPISGTVANFSVLSVLTKSGDYIMSLATPSGGHISHNKRGAPTALRLKTINYAFDYDEMNIDVDKTRKDLENSRIEPTVFILGASLFLFPHPVKEVSDLAGEYNAVVIYDAAHVLGLIAGKTFQDPIREGANIITSSTHKTFPGPQGGIVATDSDGLFEKIKRGIFPRMTSNHHLHRLPSLGITTVEMLMFGEKYAKQVVKNAKVLAEEAYALGLPVIAENKGFTESHQVAMDMSKIGLTGGEAADLAEMANIIINKNLLPWEPLKNVKNPNGVRIGVQEMTKFGMKEDEMKQIAEFMKRLWIDKEPPEKVKEDVINLRSQFRKQEYCLEG